MNDSAESRRIRRRPPAFRVLAVEHVTQQNPYLVSVTLGGSALEGFEIPQPAASVRLLIPSPGSDELVIPEWNGNEFLLPGEVRPILRTFTPRRFDADRLLLDLEIVLHEGGVTSDWVRRAHGGDPAAISGPGRGYEIDPAAPGFLLAGDQTALPAISQLLEALPPDAAARVVVEIVHPDAETELPDRGPTTASWPVLPDGEVPGTALLAALEETDIEPGTKVWVAGEAAALHRVRRLLLEKRGLDRTDVTARGYWKHGR